MGELGVKEERFESVAARKKVAMLLMCGRVVTYIL
jgi:hypothetical protein